MAQNVFAQRRVETIFSPINPLDKSTIFSILPKKVVERKITCNPGLFEIEPGTPEEPSRLVIGPSSWFKEIFEANQALEVSMISMQMAQSVCDDYCNSVFGYNLSSRPGLFWLPGDISLEKLRKEFPHVLADAIAKQKNWFLFLLNAADAAWAQTNGNPRAISDDMRFAANQLGKTDKAWLENYSAIEMVRCVGCGNMKSPAFPVCPTCKTVTDPKKFKELGLSIAG